MTKSSEAISDWLGIPNLLLMTREERAQAWERHPPKAMPVRDYRQARPSTRSDADHEAFLKAQAKVEEERKKVKLERLEAFKATRPVKEKRPSREGLIDVATIAATLKMTPREARMILRAAKIAKPACGWAGDKAWAAMITKVLKRH